MYWYNEEEKFLNEKMEYARNYLKMAFYGDRNNCIIDGYKTEKDAIEEPILYVYYKGKMLIVDTCNERAYDNDNDFFEEIIIKDDEFICIVVAMWYEEFSKGWYSQNRINQKELNELIKKDYEEFTKFLEECYC